MNSHPEVQNFYSMMLPIMLLALMGWGEARGEPELGKYAVAWVARNRVYARRNYGKTWEKVLLRKNAFSCFNDTDVNRDKLEDLVFTIGAWPSMKIHFIVAFNVYFGMGTDPTDGATHYFRKDLSPSWASKMVKTAEIGNHVFYKYKDE